MGGGPGMPVGTIGLVIFDCDGVLVDSERLVVRTEAAILSRLGWELSEAEIIDRFVGRSARYMHSEIERVLGREIDWEEEFEVEYRRVLASDLVAVDGIVDLLDEITVATCVASSGNHEKIRFSLGLTNLLDHFGDRIFSVEDVERGKPDPDVFLYAADQMGFEPYECAVIEDSVSGVTAGIAAGMQVFAFAGGVTSASKLTMDGALVFHHMSELHRLIFP